MFSRMFLNGSIINFTFKFFIMARRYGRRRGGGSRGSKRLSNYYVARGGIRLS